MRMTLTNHEYEPFTTRDGSRACRQCNGTPASHESMPDELREFLLSQCRPLREALALAFDEVYEDGGYLKAKCCGQEVRYKSGIFGTDFAYCDTCKSEIRLILSPHVSPILLGNGYTRSPSNKLIEWVGENEWWVSKLSG